MISLRSRPKDETLPLDTCYANTKSLLCSISSMKERTKIETKFPIKILKREQKLYSFQQLVNALCIYFAIWLCKILEMSPRKQDGEESICRFSLMLNSSDENLKEQSHIQVLFALKICAMPLVLGFIALWMFLWKLDATRTNFLSHDSRETFTRNPCQIFLSTLGPWCYGMALWNHCSVQKPNHALGTLGHATRLIRFKNSILLTPCMDVKYCL
jgi:hypothetical protein